MDITESFSSSTSSTPLSTYSSASSSLSSSSSSSSSSPPSSPSSSSSRSLSPSPPPSSTSPPSSSSPPPSPPSSSSHHGILFKPPLIPTFLLLIIVVVVVISSTLPVVESIQCFKCNSKDDAFCNGSLNVSAHVVGKCQGDHCLVSVSWVGSFNSPTSGQIMRDCTQTDIGLLYSVYDGVYSRSSSCSGDLCNGPLVLAPPVESNVTCYSCTGDQCLNDVTSLNTCNGPSCFEANLTDRANTQGNRSVLERGCTDVYYVNKLTESETGDSQTAVCNGNKCNYDITPVKELIECRWCIGEECELPLGEQKTCMGFSCITINVTQNGILRYEKDCLADYWANYCGLEVDSYGACSCETDMCNDLLQNPNWAIQWVANRNVVTLVVVVAAVEMILYYP